MCMLYACLSIPFIEHDGSNANSTIVDLYIHNHIVLNFVNKRQSHNESTYFTAINV